MSREKTKLRHITREGKTVRVTKEEGKYYIGNSSERAEGKMIHHSSIGKAKYEDDDEWSDYAHTAEDL